MAPAQGSVPLNMLASDAMRAKIASPITIVQGCLPDRLFSLAELPTNLCGGTLR